MNVSYFIFTLGGDQSIYRVATDQDIALMMTDYRRRKNRHSLPSRHSERRTNPFLEQRPSRPQEPVPPEINEERTTSMMKVRIRNIFKKVLIK